MEKLFRHSGFATATTNDEIFSYLNSSVRTVILISGKMGEVFIPKLHSLQTVKSIVIYCYKIERYLPL